jgi:flagellar hook-associated protein 1 FlgK
VVDPNGAQARTRADFDNQFPASLTPTSGKLGALLDVYQNTLPHYQARLDQLAVALHDDLNAAHAAGYGLTGTTGQRFFAGATITGASQLAVDPAVLADPRLIAAASSATSGAGDSSNAMAILARRQAISGSLGTTFDDHYSATISDLGVAAQAASRDKDTSDAVVNTLQSRRDATSGVSLDEEMANLIKFQHAYAAAGRVMSVMDQLLDTLIHIGA